MRRSAAALVALALVAGTLRAADDWRYGVSGRFEVYTTAGLDKVADALRTFEEIHAFFVSQLRLTLLDRDHTRLVVFANDKEFAPFRPEAGVTAFYQKGADRDYIVMARLDKDATAVAVHEYAHLFLQRYGGRFPVWLREGMAEAFSTMRVETGGIRYGDPHAQHLKVLRSGAALHPVSRLFAVEEGSNEYATRDHTSVLYAQSWALVHMLLMDRRYEAKYWDFVGQVGNGASSADALMTVYGKTPDAVMSDLEGYIQRPQSSSRVVANPRLLGSAKGGPADAFEIALITGSLRADAPGGEAEGRATLEKLEQERPLALSVLESRAYLELRRGRRDAALRYFERAAAEGTSNARLLYDYARLDPARAAALLPKAMTLDPDNVDLRFDYAARLMEERKGSEAVVALSVMNGLSRGQSFRRFRMLADAHLMANQFAEAREAANGVRRLADSDATRTVATELMARVEDGAAKAAAAAREAPAISFSDDVIPPPAAAPAAAPAAGNVTQETMLTMAGRIRNIVCLPRNGGLVLEVLVDKQTLRLLLAKPEAVSVRGLTGGTVDLNCRKQDQPVKVGFIPRNDPAQKTQGDLQVLDYSK